MAPVGAEGGADVAAGMGDDPTPQGSAAGKKGSYVPPALRGDRASAAGERMGGSKYGERDDLATLRVTNVSSLELIDLDLSSDAPRPRRMPENQRLMHMVSRFPKWPKRENFVTCSNGLVASHVYSLLRTGILV